MRGRCILACVAALAGPARGEGLSVEFTWSALDLSTLDLGDGRVVYAVETLVAVTPDTRGALIGLRGRCLTSGLREPEAGRHAGAGVCVLSDGAGSELVLRIVERTDGPGRLVEGEGRWEGRQGRFAGAAGAIRYGLANYGLSPEGAWEGTGRMQGDLSGASPPEPETLEPRLRLRPGVD